MSRPITMITGQWGDLKSEELFAIMQRIGFNGAELACGGDHFDIQKALHEPGYCEKNGNSLKNIICPVGQSAIIVSVKQFWTLLIRVIKLLFPIMFGAMAILLALIKEPLRK